MGPAPHYRRMVGQDVSPYQLLGGADGVRTLVERFYQRMDRDPRFAALRKLHQHDLSETSEFLFRFLSGWFGGPNLYFQGPEHRCVMSAHRNLAIGAQEVGQWLACMNEALRDANLGNDMTDRISTALSSFANRMRNKD